MVNFICVGGSIGGVSCAAALLRQGGNEVTVLERAAKTVPAGAGLGLDPITLDMLNDLGFKEEVLKISRPIPKEEYRFVDNRVPLAERKAVSLIVNEQHLHRSLPRGTVQYGHKVTSYKQDAQGVTVTAEVMDENGKPQQRTFTADYLIAADGSNSTIRRLMHPEDKRRYAGMIAWRGVVEGDKHPQLLQQLRKDFVNLDSGIIFDISSATGMNLIYVLANQRINWLWYRDAPEPHLPGYSVTVQATEEDLQKLHRDAGATWTESFVDLIKTTERPFINAIFDKDPIQRWCDGRVVLLGEAAHPTTPHGSRSTNMSLQDSYILGRCFAKHKDGMALKEFEKARMAQTAQEVLFSRYVGELRQGRWVDPATFDWPAQPQEVKALLLNAKRSLPDYRATALDILKQNGCSNGALLNGYC